MFSKEEIKKIRQEVELFFEKMGFEADFSLSSEEETVLLSVKSDEPRVLIGEKGRVLAELQRILRAVLIRKTGRYFYLDVDVNDYRKKKNQYLKEIAKEAADKAALNKEEVSLSPMSAYERRIVHLELASRPDVFTESVGVEPKRRVVIKPKFQ
jgi:spoIIIJ-associated protein